MYSLSTGTPAFVDVNTNKLGTKKYELTNHLGNVLAVITDRNLVTSGGTPSTYEAVVIMKSDYYPFGMEMPGRNSNTSAYRFGYNGMESDKEVKGEGNSYTTEFRQYDPRLGRWLSIDPLISRAPGWNPYRFGFDNPILFTDQNGLFEDRKEAKAYKKEHNIQGSIRKEKDNTYSIYSEKSSTLYHKATEEDRKLGSNAINSEGVVESGGAHASGGKFRENLQARLTAIGKCKTPEDHKDILLATSMSAKDDNFQKNLSKVGEYKDALNQLGTMITAISIDLDVIQSEFGDVNKFLTEINKGKFYLRYNGILKTYQLRFNGNKQIAASAVTTAKAASAAFGIEMGSAVRVVKGTGVVLNFVGLGLTVLQGVEEYNATGTVSTETMVDGVMGVVGFCGPVGTGISLIYGFILKPLHHSMIEYRAPLDTHGMVSYDELFGQ